MSLCAVLSIATFAALAAAHSAEAADTQAILHSCEAVLAGKHRANTGQIDIPSTGLPCWQYLGAIQDMSVLVDQNGQRLLGICAPEATTLLDYVHAFVQYATRNPSLGTENAAAAAVEALGAAFPCQRAANTIGRLAQTNRGGKRHQ